MIDIEHEAIFKLLDRIDVKLDTVDTKMDIMSSACSQRLVDCSKCRLEDQKETIKEIGKRPNWSLVQWLFIGVFTCICYLVIVDVDIRKDISHMKTELSVHVGAVIKNNPIVPEME